MRCSTDTACGVSSPPKLMPRRAILSVATSDRLPSQSTIGVITFCQSGRNGTLSTKSCEPWPGPSKNSTL